MFINDVLKRQTMIITVTIIGICLTLIGVSYAIFFNVKEGNTQIVESGDLVIQFTDGTLLKDNLIPVTDEEGKSQTPYTFSVRNQGSLPMRYEIYIYDKEGIDSLGTKLPHEYIKVQLDNYPIKKLSELKTKDNKLLLKDNLDVKAKGAENGEDVRTHTIKVWIDDDAPEDIIGNIIALDIEVKGVVGEALPIKEFSEIVVANNSTIFTDDFGNIRYVGADPNNYIWFNCDDYNFTEPTNTEDTYAKQAAAKNCERWRIIGLMKDITTVNEDTNEPNSAKENLVKIVRAESLTPDLSWDNKDQTTGAEDDNGKNDWTDAELMYLLNPGNEKHALNGELANNSLYWNSDSGQCSSGSGNNTTACNFESTGLKGDDETSPTKSMIETVVWNIGGLTGGTTSAFYNAERGSTTYKSQPTTWNGKIGLIYPSDYGYATSGNNLGAGIGIDREMCLGTTLINWSRGVYQMDCGGMDYLKPSIGQQLWTLAPFSSYSGGVFYVGWNGLVVNDYASYAYTVTVRPSLYLTSNVKIKNEGGNGSADEPYILVP